MVLLLDDLVAVLNNFPYTATQLQVGFRVRARELHRARAAAGGRAAS
jgi:hypothetical protein